MEISVETTHGPVRGQARAGHHLFRGIPYAAPPVGALRFAAPQPPAPWTELRDATEYGFAAPQPPSLLPGMSSGPQDEDCLSLNVYTPVPDAATRPVMVWIHGGAFTGGSSGQALYDGATLTTRGQIVLVTINYRLGALGYLDLAAHTDQLPGAISNAGQRDQIAALTWVRDNIAAFGGDPDNVTIFGESAGAMAVTTLLAMPQARGLFRRAIAQSGAAHATHSRESAAMVRQVLLEELGIEANDLRQLRERSPSDILDAQTRAANRVAADVFLPFAPVIDPDSLPEHPLTFIGNGGAADIPLITGTTQDEWKLFSAADPRHPKIDDAVLPKIVRRRLERFASMDPERALETYRSARPQAAPCGIVDAIETDRRFRIPAIRLAEAQRPHQPNTFFYLFNWRSPAAGGRLGSCHALELPFVFGTLDAPTMDRFAGTGEDAEALSQAMIDAWTAFAHTGDPNLDGRPPWDPYDAVERTTMVFGKELHTVQAPSDDERALWDDVL